MDKLETIRLLDIIIDFFDTYNEMLDDIDDRINEAKNSELPKAA